MKARLDTNKDSKPLTEIVGIAPNNGNCIGPGNVSSYEVRAVQEEKNTEWLRKNQLLQHYAQLHTSTKLARKEYGELNVIGIAPYPEMKKAAADKMVECVKLLDECEQEVLKRMKDDSVKGQ